MSEKVPPTEEERKVNRNSFIIGICIGVAIIVIFTVLYYMGLFQ